MCASARRNLTAGASPSLFLFADLLTQVSLVAEFADLVHLRFKPIDVSLFIL